MLVHKFVCKGTVEERIDAMITAKQGLSDEILSGGAELSLTELDNAQLLDMFRLDLAQAVAS